MILIVSNSADAHAKVVADALAKQGHPYYLLDLSLFPCKSHISISYSSRDFRNAYYGSEAMSLHLNECGAIWWRRPQPYSLHENIKGSVERHFTMNECLSAINGLWLVLNNAFWINSPVQDEVASRKAYQLKVAVECGLTIPATLITNNPSDAKEFISRFGFGNVIYKCFVAIEQAWRETRLVKEEEIAMLDNVKYAPVIFQECIHADVDIRVTIVGNSVFAAAIHSQDNSYKYDFRMNYHESKIVEHALPEQLSNQLLKLTKKLGIIYGAVDLRMKPTGEYVFLEVNPAGQWLFTEEPTGMPITKALAQQLIDADLNENKIHRKHNFANDLYNG